VGVKEYTIILNQIGDGDIIFIVDEGQPFMPIRSNADNLFGNETHSLISSDCWKQFFGLVKEYHRASFPSLILVSTDGYRKSYGDTGESENEFLKIGADYLNYIQGEGLYYLNKWLGHFLSNTSDQGSGDDITLGLIVNQDVLDKEIVIKKLLEGNSALDISNEIMLDTEQTQETISKWMISLYEAIKSIDKTVSSKDKVIPLSKLPMDLKHKLDSIYELNDSIKELQAQKKKS